MTLTTLESICRTWLKKEPVDSTTLDNSQKAAVVAKRVFKNCEILEEKDQHLFVKFSFGLGNWWVYKPHWKNYSELKLPYAKKGDLIYLENFPYFDQKDNGPEGWRQCQSSSIAMCLKYFKQPGINDDTDYVKIMSKYGDTTSSTTHIQALKELGVGVEFKRTLDAEDIKSQIRKGKPVPVGFLHKGPAEYPQGGGHYIVITGYNDAKGYWLCQDPYGELDIVAGVWADTYSMNAGKDIHYSYKNMERRIFYPSGATGWGWLFK